MEYYKILSLEDIVYFCEIENNNGWIKIEGEKDLPKEKGLKCLFLCIHGNTTYISDDVLEDPKWFVNKYSHWRLKDEIKDPIY